MNDYRQKFEYVHKDQTWALLEKNHIITIRTPSEEHVITPFFLKKDSEQEVDGDSITTFSGLNQDVFRTIRAIEADSYRILIKTEKIEIDLIDMPKNLYMDLVPFWQAQAQELN